MTRYLATIETPLGREAAFAYLSDFSTTAEWDPGIVEAERLTDGPIGEGTVFRLVASMFGRRIPLEYTLVESKPPTKVVLFAETGMIRSEDMMTFEAVPGGTRIVYDADVRPRGALRLIEPIFAIAFRRAADRAVEGLRRRLAEIARSEAV